MKDNFTIKCLRFFMRNKLISQNQCGFKPCDFCIKQLLAITHEIYKYFDACLDVRAGTRNDFLKYRKQSCIEWKKFLMGKC